MAHGSLGVFTNTQGDQYKGSWKFDKKHGQGFETWRKSNSKYEGSYVEGVREGYGVYSINHQAVYSGQWLRGEMHGQGRLQIDYSTAYTGDFSRGRIQGFGNLQ